MAPLFACRSIADDIQRATCYDRSVDALRAAQDRREVAVIDREQVRQTKRSLFGLTVPRLAILGGADDGHEVASIDSTLAGAGEAAGGWVFRLADGSVWRQTDGVEIGRAPRAGDAVSVRRAALGSYRLSVARGPGVKVARER